MPRRPVASSRRSPDSAYKKLFSHAELVADLLRGYVDRSVAKTYDLSTLERCNGTYITPDLRERRNDVVWRMKSKHGWAYVYLLLEFQSTVDRFMAVRLLGYISLLWQDLIAQGVLPADGLLPPVLPIVLYNGDQTWTAPLHMRELLAEPPAALLHLQPSLSDHFLDENRVPTTAGMRLHNLASAIFALEQGQDLAAQHRDIALPPGIIASLYNMRWDIEKVFDAVKIKCSENKSWGSRPETKEAQARFICIAYNRMVLMEDRLENDHRIINERELERKKDRADALRAMAESANLVLAPMCHKIIRMSQRCVAFIRWLRNHIRSRGLWEDSLAALRHAYAVPIR